MNISASIVTYNTNISDLELVLDSAISNSITKIFIIDNSPSDKLKEFISDKYSFCDYLYTNSNLGYGKAHNLAIRKSIEANIKYHVVLNPDIYFNNTVIREIYDYFESHDDVGQVMPLIKYPNGNTQYLCKLIPTPTDLLFKRFLPKSIVEKRMHRFQLKFTGYDKIMNVPYLSGCFMFLRTNALKDVGLFDERFFMYPEDIDLTRRIHERYKTIFYPKVEIVHAHAAESYQSKKMLLIHIKNMIKYFNKWGWFFDSKRIKINKKVLNELKYNIRL